MIKEPYLFSIIVPTFNRERQLSDCLQSLSRLNFPREEFEVIVVEDGDRLNIADFFSFRDKIDVKFFSQPQSGPAAARNTGALEACGRYLAFVDDDCLPDSNWLKVLATNLEKQPKHAIGGRTINKLVFDTYSAASQLIVNYLYEYYNEHSPRPQFFTSNNLSLPTDLFHQTGGFDSSFIRPGAEDRDFCDRFQRMGYGMIYAKEAIVHHAHILNFPAFLKQQFNYGRGAFLLYKRRLQSGRKNDRFEPLSFYIRLLCYPLLLKDLRQIFLFSSLFLLSQGANTAGYIWESTQ